MADIKIGTCLRVAMLSTSQIATFSVENSAFSQERMYCGVRTEVMAQLAERYGEHLAAAGMTATGNVIELTVAPSGSWTLVMSFPHGRSCLMATGDQWETMPARPAGGRI